MKRERPLPVPDADELRRSVSEHYARRLAEATDCCGPDLGCCTECAPSVAVEEAGRWAGVPSFGCGDPAAGLDLRPGDTVVDLGSGAGLDAFRAAQAVGTSGRVIGVDMTPAMLARARAGAERFGYAQVEFREGEIEALPVADEEADAVISNCVLNLSADVERVLREAARVLRPGGRLRVSDTFRRGAPPGAPDTARWCACLDGAHDPAALVAQARRAGFVDVAIVGASPDADAPGVFSASLVAVKPRIEPLTDADAHAAAALLTAAGLPLDGWDAARVRRWGVRRDGRWVGVVGLEVHGRYGLVRSLAVAPVERGRGLGGALLAHALREVRALGLAGVAALTTTIPERLAAAGFREVDRAALPHVLHASPELRGACPAGARAFLLEPLP